jgi:cytochrome c oxidase subunit 4
MESATRSYLLVWGVLILLTGATWGVSYLHLGLYNAATALGIASIKAALVALFFMHLRREPPLVWLFAILPLLFLLLIIAGTLADTLFRT